MLTRDRFDAKTAGRIGLVTEVVETGDAEKRALDIAATIAAVQPEAAQQTKRILVKPQRAGMATLAVGQAIPRLFDSWQSNWAADR